MVISHPTELSESWIEGRPDLRWRSTVGSAEELVVVVSGRAEVEVDGERGVVEAGGIALIPQDVPHQVANAGDEPLRFVAVYAPTGVVTRYEAPVQPDDEQERQTIG